MVFLLFLNHTVLIHFIIKLPNFEQKILFFFKVELLINYLFINFLN